MFKVKLKNTFMVIVNIVTVPKRSEYCDVIGGNLIILIDRWQTNR